MKTFIVSFTNVAITWEHQLPSHPTVRAPEGARKLPYYSGSGSCLVCSHEVASFKGRRLWLTCGGCICTLRFVLWRRP